MCRVHHVFMEYSPGVTERNAFWSEIHTWPLMLKRFSRCSHSSKSRWSTISLQIWNQALLMNHSQIVENEWHFM